MVLPVRLSRASRNDPWSWSWASSTRSPIRTGELPAPPVREGRAWFVPVDFVPRALAPAVGTRLELRKPSRLILLGDIRVPRIGGRIEPLGSVTRLTLEVAPATPHSVAQEGSRLVVRFEADALDATLPITPVPDVIQNVRPGDTPASLTVDLGPRFGTFRAMDVPGKIVNLVVA